MLNSRQFRGISLLVGMALIVVMGGKYWRSTASWFGIAARDDEMQQADMWELQSLLGLKKWRFEYQLPPRHTLFVTLKASLDGEALPAMCTVYHIVPARPEATTYGTVQAKLYEPVFQSEKPVSTGWAYFFKAENKRGFPGNESEGIGNSFEAPYSFDRSRFVAKGEGGTSTSAADLSSGQEFDIWTYNGHWMVPHEDDGIFHEFKYRLAVRMAPLQADDKIGSVQPLNGWRFDLPH